MAEKFMPGFDCDNSDFYPTFRNMCCSTCGGQPTQIMPAPAPAPTPDQTAYQCTVCNHVYDAEKDGAGKAFEDLPSSWVCPVCGVPKKAYDQHPASGQWSVTV